MACPFCHEEAPIISSGLNNNGLILFIVLLLFCIPLCWLPFVIDSCKKKICTKCGREIQ